MRELGVSANTVIHRHANIRKALQYAFTIGLIPSNPADRVQRPKKQPFSGSIYNDKELETLFALVKGEVIELGIILAAFYGLCSSEAVGLKWSAIDFEQKTISIRHTVTQLCIDGKSTLVHKDRTKTKSSFRTLPLVALFEELLHTVKAQQEMNRRLCGKAYCTKYAEYVYVNELGDLMKPGYLTQHLPDMLEKNNMRRIRYHDLKHPNVKSTTKENLSWANHTNRACSINDKIRSAQNTYA